MYMGVLHAYMSVHHVCSWCPWRSEEQPRSLGTGVTASFMPLWRCQKSNLGLLEEQFGILTTVPRASFIVLCLGS